MQQCIFLLGTGSEITAGMNIPQMGLMWGGYPVTAMGMTWDSRSIAGTDVVGFSYPELYNAGLLSWVGYRSSAMGTGWDSHPIVGIEEGFELKGTTFLERHALHLRSLLCSFCATNTWAQRSHLNVDFMETESTLDYFNTCL